MNKIVWLNKIKLVGNFATSLRQRPRNLMCKICYTQTRASVPNAIVIVNPKV